MKKMVFLLGTLMLFSSCRSLVTSISNRPQWIDTPPYFALSTAFVGEGEGESEEDAKINAYLDAIEKMGEEVQLDYKNVYFSELYNTSRIQEFSTIIYDSYSEETDGIWHYYVLTVSNTQRLIEARSISYNERVDRETRLTFLVDKALEYYKDNRDVDAVNTLLEAVLVTMEGEITKEEYSTEVLVQRIEKYISQIEFSVDERERGSNLCAFKIQRNKGILKSAVEGASCKVIYPSLDPDGNILRLPYSVKSNEKGIVTVNETNAYSLKKGVVSITIDVDEDIIKNIDRVAGEELLRGVKSLIESITFSAEYSEDETYSEGEAVIALALYGYDGGRIDIEVGRKIISSMCAALYLDDVTVVEAEGEDEEETLQFLKDKYGDRFVIYMVRIGVVDRIHTLGLWYTKTEGNIVKITPSRIVRDGYKTMQYSSVSSTEAPDDEKALENQIRLTVGFVLGEF